MAIVLETKRTLLREFVITDVNALAPIMADPDVMRFSVNGPLTTEQTRYAIHKRGTCSYIANGFGLWAVIYKQDQNLIGGCGLITQLIDGELCVELGYRLAKQYWGQGLGTEVTRAIRDYAFTKLGLKCLIAIIEAENTASVRIAEKMGMIIIRKTNYYSKPVCIYEIKQ